MKTDFDVLDRLFPILNVAAVTETLGGGKVYRRKRPATSTARDIVLVALSLSGDDNVQRGTFFVNCFAPNLANGQPDETTLRATVAAVVAALSGYSASSEYFTIELISQSVFPDENSDQWSYASVRMNYLIEA